MMTTRETNPEADGPGAPPDVRMMALLGLVFASLAWASWPALADMARTWSDDTRYSHGFLVVPFAIYLLWHRRGLLAGGGTSASWWGVPLLLIGAALKLAGARYFMPWLDGISLLPTLAGIALAIGGRAALRWAWPAIGFLFFMVPLPHRVENAVGPPLQRLATLASTYLLQTCGLPAQADGNVINLEDVRIGVVEACNGLGMLMMFFAYATAVAIVIRRHAADRAILVLSAAPIAMIANVLRISTTGLLHAYSTRAVADHVYHDLAGWLMMPMALAMFGAELFILARLLVESQPAPGLPAGSTMPPRPGSPLIVDIRTIARGPGKHSRS
jgi:exosortase